MTPRNKENGIALFIALVALSLLSLLGLSVAYNAMTEMQISNNMETGVASLFLAESGAELAREMARGTDFNVLLTGPNLVGNTTNPAGQGFAYRNPMELAAARTLDLDGDVRFVTGGVANDDGVVSFVGLNGMKYRKRAASDFTYYQTSGPDGVFGTGDEVTIPTGTPVLGDDVTLGRVLVKVSNNPQELGVTPFQTSLSRVVMRVMAVTRTLGEGFAGASRRNSMSVVELVLRHDLTFNLDSPLLVEGDDPKPAQSGKFVTGDGKVTGLGVANVPGIGTIDTDLAKHSPPDDIIRDDITNPQNVIGGTTPNPSVEDIRSSFDPVPPVPQSQSDVAAWAAYQQAKDRYNLLDPSFLWKFANEVVPKMTHTKIPADTTLSASNVGVGAGKYDLGYWNLSNPSDPNNRPRIALAEGDLTVSGSVQGAGLLVIRGNYDVSSGFVYDGVVLVIGEGEVEHSGNPLLRGGMFIVKVKKEGNGTVKFEEPKFTLTGNSELSMNSANVRMALSLIPFRQISWREITPAIDQ